MAVINGAKSLEEIIRTVRAGFFAVIRVCTILALKSCTLFELCYQVTWIVSPLSMVFAQQFLPMEVCHIVIRQKSTCN